MMDRRRALSRRKTAIRAFDTALEGQAEIIQRPNIKAEVETGKNAASAHQRHAEAVHKGHNYL